MSGRAFSVKHIRLIAEARLPPVIDWARDHITIDVYDLQEQPRVIARYYFVKKVVCGVIIGWRLKDYKFVK